MTKVQSHVMLVLCNVRMVPSNVRKKNKGTTECDKSTMRTIPSNVRKKNKGTTECDKSTMRTIPSNVRKN